MCWRIALCSPECSERLHDAVGVTLRRGFCLRLGILDLSEKSVVLVGLLSTPGQFFTALVCQRVEGTLEGFNENESLIFRSVFNLIAAFYVTV